MGGNGAMMNGREGSWDRCKRGGARMGREDRWKRRGLGWMETMGARMN